MGAASSNEQLLGRYGLQSFRRRQVRIEKLKKKKLIHKAYLKDQILNHDRIDLLMTEVLGYEIKDFHLGLYLSNKKNSLVISNNEDKNQRWNLTLAPRGFGKSTCLNISRCILEILKNPNIRILIASKTDTNAVAFLSEIKQKLQRKALTDIFGPQQGSPWNDGNIRVATRTSDNKEDTIETIGIGGALASKHYDLIIADDLIDEANSMTEGQREKILTWFLKVLDPTLEPHGEMSIIGTRYNPEDLYGYLIVNVLHSKGEGGRIRRHYQVLPSLLKIKGVGRGTRESKRYTSLWPEKCSVEFLLKKRRILGTIIFNTQYQNDVEAMKGKIFKIDWFKYFSLQSINLSELKIFQGIDLAIKQSESADKFAHVTIGIHPRTKNIYVLDYFNEVTHYNDQKRVTKEMFYKYDPIRVAVEANGYQQAFLQDINTDDELASIRTTPLFTEKDKTTRAWKLSAYFERGQVFFREGMNEFVEHLLQFPHGRYKDLFDALDNAISCAFGGARRIRDREPGII